MLRTKVLPEFTRPYLYPKQEAAIFCPERLALIEAGTKSGKTVGCMAWLTEQALKGQNGRNYWWIAPGYSQAEIAYRRIKHGLTKGSFTAFDTPVPRIHTMVGTVIWFKSADNPDALYGEDVYAAVIDEASRVAEGSWHAIRSTLTATRGPVRIIGNVKGRKNWFYNLARKAEAEMLAQPDPAKRRMHYSMITADDAVTAGVLDKEEIEDAKAVLPEQVFRELYYNEPSDDSGNPFGLDHIRACTSAEGLASGPVVAWGIDLAKKQDYFVCIGLNASGAVAGFKRWRGVPWRNSIRQVWALVGEDTPALVDSTGVGDPVLEELQYEHGNFHGYHFSPASKQKLMEGLAVSIQSREIAFPDGYIRQELEAFEYEIAKTGVKYAAPAGMNDDCVCALALARQMWTEVAPGDNVTRFYQNIIARGKEQRTESKDPARPWETQDVGPMVITIDDLGTELNELYESTLRNALPLATRSCAACGKPVESVTKVTDGEFVWHVECSRLRPRVGQDA